VLAYAVSRATSRRGVALGAVTLVRAEALIGATILACLAPALRAMRVDPIAILRST
jgi:ABC-type lipoprotein release transport system permease subunit